MKTVTASHMKNSGISLMPKGGGRRGGTPVTSPLNGGSPLTVIIHILMVPCQWVFAKVENNHMECKQVPSMRSGEAIRGIAPDQN